MSTLFFWEKKKKDNLSIIAFSTWSQAEESKNQSTPP